MSAADVTHTFRVIILTGSIQTDRYEQCKLRSDAPLQNLISVYTVTTHQDWLVTCDQPIKSWYYFGFILVDYQTGL